jgi:succinate dehydrogenase / fumarate reductase cytochrome b subunit
MTELDQRRPVFFDLLRISFPVGAITSIGHRISGVVLAGCTPVLIYLLDASLSSAAGYERVRAALDTAPARALAALLLWAFMHHFLAGIRHLLMDVDVGSSLSAARRSAWLVNVAAIALAVLGVAVLP